ncbi:WYL domain-containing protein [Nakamurella sp. UYEF19]|uniref:helix-turn-helix transcriptional regulator n=1 Tax=Nakamurella sp. UYEF19 TaxID=1756392 RepID=UPI0033959467
MPKTSARLLSLLSLLQARRDWPGPLLAERLDISARTVRRDVDRLRELGYSITASKGPEGGYRLDSGAQLPPLLFDDEQAVALAVALRIATTSGAGIAEAALRALNTVRQVMPARLRARIDTLQVTAVNPPPSGPDPQVDSGLLMTLGAAVHGREVLRFDYASEDPPGSNDQPRADQPTAHRVEPHHLVTWGDRWYLVAWDLDRTDWRTFRADRISPRTLTGPRFTPRELPGGDDVSAFVTKRFRGSESATGPGGWSCQGEVILDLPAVAIRPYTREGIVEAVGPDRCRLSLGAWSWTALAATIGRFDADIEVVGPPELAAAFGRLARRYADTASRAGISDRP